MFTLSPSLDPIPTLILFLTWLLIAIIVFLLSCYKLFGLFQWIQLHFQQAMINAKQTYAYHGQGSKLYGTMPPSERPDHSTLPSDRYKPAPTDMIPMIIPSIMSSVWTLITTPAFGFTMVCWVRTVMDIAFCVLILFNGETINDDFSASSLFGIGLFIGMFSRYIFIWTVAKVALSLSHLTGTAKTHAQKQLSFYKKYVVGQTIWSIIFCVGLAILPVLVAGYHLTPSQTEIYIIVIWAYATCMPISLPFTFGYFVNKLITILQTGTASLSPELRVAREETIITMKHLLRRQRIAVILATPPMFSVTVWPMLRDHLTYVCPFMQIGVLLTVTQAMIVVRVPVLNPTVAPIPPEIIKPKKHIIHVSTSVALTPKHHLTIVAPAPASAPASAPAPTSTTPDPSPTQHVLVTYPPTPTPNLITHVIPIEPVERRISVSHTIITSHGGIIHQPQQRVSPPQPITTISQQMIPAHEQDTSPSASPPPTHDDIPLPIPFQITRSSSLARLSISSQQPTSKRRLSLFSFMKHDDTIIHELDDGC